MAAVKMDIVTPDRILELGQVFRACKTLLSAVELGVFTVLGDGVLDLATLAERVSIQERCARDFLDALVALGLLVRYENGHYANASESALYLDRSKPTYVGSLLERFGRLDYRVWDNLTNALRTGAPQEDSGAAGHFGPAYADDGLRDQFVRGMTVRTLPVARALARRFAWSGYERIVDIGTAEGCLPVEIVKAHPHMGGGGFDLAPLQFNFNRYVASHGLSDRLQFYPGDFFSDPLPSADVLVLGRVLHNWDLVTKKMLLKKAYDALPPNGALIVYEHLIDNDRRSNTTALLASIQMLLSSAGGFNFTGADCALWMQESGFKKIQVEPLTTDQSMVVGVK
jgi:O-methyltransferase domain/Dimerisation domain